MRARRLPRAALAVLLALTGLLAVAQVPSAPPALAVATLLATVLLATLALVAACSGATGYVARPGIGRPYDISSVAVLRDSDPDAAGHARPRAPGAPVLA